MRPQDEQQVRLARIGKPHGIRGEVTVELFTDMPESRFAASERVFVRYPDGSDALFDSLTVENSRWHKKILLIKFTEILNRTSAEQLRGAELFASVEGTPKDEDGWYRNELIGLAVLELRRSSPKVGVIIDLVLGAAQDLLEVELSDKRKVLIPFVKEIVPEVDTDEGFVVITPPPGLLELNQD